MKGLHVVPEVLSEDKGFMREAVALLVSGFKCVWHLMGMLVCRIDLGLKDSHKL